MKGLIYNYCQQRVRVWFVAMARTKLAKEKEPEGDQNNFSSKYLKISELNTS